MNLTVRFNVCIWCTVDDAVYIFCVFVWNPGIIFFVFLFQILEAMLFKLRSSDKKKMSLVFFLLVLFNNDANTLVSFRFSCFVFRFFFFFCSDQHGTGTCNYECAGNPEETCGGHTVMTVYSMDE